MSGRLHAMFPCVVYPFPLNFLGGWVTRWLCVSYLQLLPLSSRVGLSRETTGKGPRDIGSKVPTSWDESNFDIKIARLRGALLAHRHKYGIQGLTI
jgi:hypothetical protein